MGSPRHVFVFANTSYVCVYVHIHKYNFIHAKSDLPKPGLGFVTVLSGVEANSNVDSMHWQLEGSLGWMTSGAPCSWAASLRVQ